MIRARLTVSGVHAETWNCADWVGMKGGRCMWRVLCDGR